LLIRWSMAKTLATTMRLERGPTISAAEFEPVDNRRGGKPDAPSVARLRSVQVDKLQGHALQPAHRHAPEEVRDLAESIEKLGLLQPPLVWQRGGGDYVILAGHRRVAAWWRLRAERKVGARIRVLVVAACSEAEAMYALAAEMLQRADASAVHTAELIAQAWEARRQELRREPTIREMASVIPTMKKTVLAEYRLIGDALHHPELGPLVRVADKSSKSKLLNALRRDEIPARCAALTALAEGYVGRPRSNGEGVARPPSWVRQRRGSGYDFTVRIRTRMEVAEIADSLSELDRVRGELQAALASAGGSSEGAQSSP
jgi:hypothetical protein